MTTLKESLAHPGEAIRKDFYEDYTVTGLKIAIVVWALVVSIAAIFFINNKWVLAGMLAYIILP